jgi:hypothetical protein
MGFDSKGKLVHSTPLFGTRTPPRADNRMAGHVWKEALSLRDFATNAEVVHQFHTERGDAIEGEPVIEVPGAGVMKTKQVLALLKALGVPKKGERGT